MLLVEDYVRNVDGAWAVGSKFLLKLEEPAFDLILYIFVELPLRAHQMGFTRHV